MEEQTSQQEEKIVCEFCKDYSGTMAQVRGHRYHCKFNPAKATVPEPTIIQEVKAEVKEEVKPEPKVEVRTRPEPERKKRIPFGSPQRKLYAPEGDGFQYRIFNDNWRKEPGRIQRALQAGYEKVAGFEPMSVGTNDDGTAIKGILMRIPKDIYDADQKLKQRENDRVDQAIRRGKLDEKEGDNRYIPQGIKIWSNQNENG